MKFGLFAISLFLTALPASPQSWEAVKNNSREYICGEGWGSSVDEADKQALNELISKISVHVTGSASSVETETVHDGEVGTESRFQSVVSTYSQATLNNTERIILEDDPDGTHVGRWMRRSEVNKIFESRKAKIRDYVSSALKAETQGKIDVALKDFYWALSLLKSLQYPNEMEYETENDGNVILMTWIPRQMDEIFRNLKVNETRRDGNEVELMFRYKNIPVNSIDYAYFDGRGWSNICSAKDGVGILELVPGTQSSYYRLRFEYMYKGESRIDREVEEVLNTLSSDADTPMPKAWQSVKSNTSEGGKSGLNVTASASFSNVPESIFRKPEEVKDIGKYREIINQVIRSVTSKQYTVGTSCFTPYGLDIYNRLIRYGRAKVVGNPSIKFYKSDGNIIVRGIQMSFSFSTGIRKSFVEDMVFTFNDEGKIDNISFGLGKTAEDDILGKGVWSESARFAIMNFLENYQTAYALKRLDYIENVFDDDAVIITGTVAHVPTRRSGGDSQRMAFAHDIVKYNRHTKDSYLQRLKESFAGKEFINLRFADNDVRKLGKGGELYSIQISQEYYSSNYGDKGYLFLMVDINDPEKPRIMVRTWQPEKDPNFGIYGPEDFK